MSDFEERTVHGLSIRIDRSLCAGFGQCIDEAPKAFKLDDRDIVTFDDPQAVERQSIVDAGDICPVEALSVFDADGKQLAPSSLDG